MNADPLLGVDDQWNASGSSSFVRPADTPLGWDRVVYFQFDNFAGQDAVATYLTWAQGALEPYNPLLITLPESGIPANAFASRVSYPFPNDPGITVDRVIFGGRRRSDGFLITFDGYDSPFPDDEIIDISRATSRTYGDLFNTEAPLLETVPFYGNPQDTDFFWNRYADAVVRRYADGEEDVESRAAFNEGAIDAWTASYSCSSEQLGTDFGVFTSGWGFEDANQAAAFVTMLPDRLVVTDRQNNVTRYFLPEPVSLDNGAEAVVDLFNWEVQPDQVLRGIELTQQAGNGVLSIAFIDTQPAADVLPPDDPNWAVPPAPASDQEWSRYWYDRAGEGGWQGFQVVDVSDPANPRPLSFGHDVPFP
jgi:hypothetical protein